MAYEIRELEPWQTRKVIATPQLWDTTPDQAGEYKLLVGEKNTFMIHLNRGSAMVMPPFEEKLEEPLDDVVKFLSKENPYINFVQFPVLAMQKFHDIICEGGAVSFRFFQTPLESSYYAKKLKRFKKSGFKVERLSKEEDSALVKLNNNWVDEKVKGVLSQKHNFDLSTEEGVDEAVAKLYQIQGEIKTVKGSRNDAGMYEKSMKDPAVVTYGVKRDGELLAYTQIMSNDNFLAFNSRAAKRVNSFSPQEFLDYEIAKEAVEKGITLFDRGPFQMRDGMEGLMEYKRKFGPMYAKRETSFNNVRLGKSSSMKYVMKNVPIRN